MTVIRVENLGKKYRIGANGAGSDGLRHAIHDLFTNPLRKARNGHSNTNQQSAIRTPQSEDFWALKDVSFEVKQGEVVGIIGRNGAGKSTLLKILSRITEPTTGRLGIRGRVASLLEVGTGFHPELTGRENVFLNGAILGMTRQEIKRKFDEIVAFAEIEKFIDTPVKRYSSGMYVRLAFAVAAHLEPEILIVDEVLAVGDAQFQKKCLGKMGEVSKQGRTVLFVSHNMQAITALTHRVLLLSEGRCQLDGRPADVISWYLHDEGKRLPNYIDSSSSDQGPKVTKVLIRTSEEGNVQTVGKPMELEFELTTLTPISGAGLSFQICDSMQRPIVHLLTLDSELPMLRSPGTFRVVCRIPKVHLYLGQYSLRIYLAERPGGEIFQTIDDICHFEVMSPGEFRDHYWQTGTCTYLEDCDWQVTEERYVSSDLTVAASS